MRASPLRAGAPATGSWHRPPTALNSTLRRGLASGSDRAQRPYRLASRPLDLRPGIDLEHALRFAGELEDAETIRKLELRK